MAAEAPLELAERALSYADGDAQVTVVHERSLSSRFARSAPDAGDRRRRHDRRDPLPARRAHRAATDEPARRGLAARGGARADAVASASAPRGARRPPRPAGARGDAAPHGGLGRADRRARPRRGRGRAARRVRASPPRPGWRRSGSGPPAPCARRSPRRPGVRADGRRDRRVHEGRLPRRGRPQRLRGAHRALGRPSSTPPRSPQRAAAPRAARGRLGARRRASTRSCSRPTPSPILLEFAGLLAFNGLAHAEGRGALSGRLGDAGRRALDQPQRRAALPGTLPRAYDAEGVPKRPVRSSRTASRNAVVHDLRSAARAGDGARSTGHAVEAGGSPVRPGADEPRAHRRRRGGRGRARRADRARHLRHAALVRQRGARAPDAADRHDPRRHVPHRGRADRPAGAGTCASPTRSCASWRRRRR